MKAGVPVDSPCASGAPAKTVEEVLSGLQRSSAMASSDQAPWHGMRGVKRVTSEFKYLSNKIKRGEWPQVKDLTVVGDDMSRWRFKLCNFDNDMEGGKHLNDDLNILAALHKQDHILMECSFPADYPNKPFFLRIVSPRMCWYTGHVTAGGSICIEALTLSGTAGSWTSQYNMEAILNIVILNMIDCDVYWIQTPTGPGGLSGPLRVDLEGKWTGSSRSVTREYSWHEAQAAFERTAANHRQSGWGPPGR